METQVKNYDGVPMETQIKNYVGIDVSKKQLDVHLCPQGHQKSFANEEDSFAKLIAYLQPYAPERIVLEATGGLEKPVAIALALAKLPVVVVNAKQVRAFAIAVGIQAKTDALDAAVIALFAQRIEPPVRPLPSAEHCELRDLGIRREQLLTILVAEKNRLSRASGSLKTSITSHITWLQQQIADLEKQMDEQITSQSVWKEKDTLLQSVPSVGKILSRVLLAELPELGTLSNKKITALVGLAPYNRESGTWKGRRFISGGRAFIRTKLYMASLSAIQHNPVFKKFYQHLIQQGKKAKVALTAVMRKLLIILNAMLRDQRSWDEEFVSKKP